MTHKQISLSCGINLVKLSSTIAICLMFTISLLSLPFDLDRNDDNLSPVAVYGEKYNFRNSNGSTDSIPFMGVNMRGLYTSLQHDTNRYSNAPFPIGYYENSFKLISQAGMNHVRYVFYWEAYEKNPSLFLRELETVANTADKWNLKVLYDNHQYHTSSWLDPKNGTGFPPSIFFRSNPSAYPQGSGGEANDKSAKVWWTSWWNRDIRDINGVDGWTLLAGFLKEVVNIVDKHPSTLGYEILNEPQIHSDSQWEKIGKFNTFISNELREAIKQKTSTSGTSKTIIYSQQIPAVLHDSKVNTNPENVAKMAPDNKSNIMFKITLYGLPDNGNYHEDKLNAFIDTAKIADVPIYIGEWNNVKRDKSYDSDETKVIDGKRSDLSQREAIKFVQSFKKNGVWGVAYWCWNYIPHHAPNLNLISVEEDGRSIEPTKYYEILKVAASSNT